MSDDEESYPRTAEETVRRVRVAKRANRTELIMDIPRAEADKVGIGAGDSLDVIGHPEDATIVIKKLVPQQKPEQAEKVYDKTRRNSPR